MATPTVPGMQLSNGHVVKYVAASGALAFDGKGWPWEQPLRWEESLDETLFTTFIKTLTLEPRRGNLRMWNPFGCIRFIPDGVVNAVGLTNPGAYWWCKRVGPKIDSGRASVAGSIFGSTAELVEMAKMLNDFDLVALEQNASCPNSGEDLSANADMVIASCHEVHEASRFPQVLKLSVAQDCEKIVSGVMGVVEAISINSVPWSTIFPATKSPLAHLGGGGVSGKVAHPFTWSLASRLKQLTDIPVIAPSVWDFKDISTLRNEYRHTGAISFGAVFMRYPWRPTEFVRRDLILHS